MFGKVVELICRFCFWMLKDRVPRGVTVIIYDDPTFNKRPKIIKTGQRIPTLKPGQTKRVLSQPTEDDPLTQYFRKKADQKKE